MKWVVAIAVASGCYKPSNFDCKVGEPCPPVAPSDAPVDTGIDPLCGFVGWGDTPAVIVAPVMDATRGSFTVTANGTIATAEVYNANLTHHQILIGDPGTTVFSGMALKDDEPTFSYRTPRLAPEGTELYVQKRPTTGFAYDLQVLEEGQQSWQLFTITVLISDSPIVITADDFPGTPTAKPVSGRRRMMMQLNGEFAELEEIDSAARQWRIITTYSSNTFGLEFAGDPQLSPDGLRLVFVGEKQGERGIYGARRTELVAPFMSATRLLGPITGPNPRFPFLAADCSKLFVRTSNMAVSVYPREP